MKRAAVVILALAAVILGYSGLTAAESKEKFRLGNEVLMTDYYHLIKGKRVGLVTNQSGVTSDGTSMIDVLAGDKDIKLTALFGPEHGIDGKATAGAYVQSYTHPGLGIPVYSLYGNTRKPTGEMLANIDVLLFDIQDIGARSYTYMSTLNYCMVAAREHNKQVVVLDRPNPLGGLIVDGPVMEDPCISFVGVDNLPMAHGMTAGELALFFNRKIGANITVVPMEGYTRDMIFQDTGLPWVQTSPNIPDLDSVFGYMSTGLGEGTGIFQGDKFKWIGGNGLDKDKFDMLLNGAGLPGVRFVPEQRGSAGGVRLEITDYHSFNPAKTGIYALTYARQLTGFKVPKSGQTVVMFDKIMGTDKIGQYLEQGLSPQQVEAKYEAALNRFKGDRQKYLIYGTGSRQPSLPEKPIKVEVNGTSVDFDSPPYIDGNSRVMVPLRAVAEGLGVSVHYDPDTRVIDMERHGHRVVLTLGSNRAMVGGGETIMDTKPDVKNSRTMVPLRYVGEFFGAKVDWDASSRTVTVD